MILFLTYCCIVQNAFFINNWLPRYFTFWAKVQSVLQFQIGLFKLQQEYRVKCVNFCKVFAIPTFTSLGLTKTTARYLKLLLIFIYWSVPEPHMEFWNVAGSAFHLKKWTSVLSCLNGSTFICICRNQEVWKQ